MSALSSILFHQIQFFKRSSFTLVFFSVVYESKRKISPCQQNTTECTFTVTHLAQKMSSEEWVCDTVPSSAAEWSREVESRSACRNKSHLFMKPEKSEDRLMAVGYAKNRFWCGILWLYPGRNVFEVALSSPLFTVYLKCWIQCVPLFSNKVFVISIVTVVFICKSSNVSYKSLYNRTYRMSHLIKCSFIRSVESAPT